MEGWSSNKATQFVSAAESVSVTSTLSGVAVSEVTVGTTLVPWHTSIVLPPAPQGVVVLKLKAQPNMLSSVPSHTMPAYLPSVLVELTTLSSLDENQLENPVNPICLQATVDVSSLHAVIHTLFHTPP